MGTRKKGSELVFNLQWRNKAENGGDKSNVIGMFDTPTTTSNFEMFKSYLIKNAGVASSDVKVTYLTDNDEERVIDSQESFDLALAAFRLKARLGELILLKLGKASTAKPEAPKKHSNDVETQSEATQPDLDSMGSNVITPPEWFIAYMQQFKRDIVDEIMYAVSSNLAASAKEKEKESIPTVIPCSKKSKPETSKRSRKHGGLGETPIDKELSKNLKFDRKLENKLDKLDAKTKKIKERKQALMNKIESEQHRYFGGRGKNASVAVPKKETVQTEIPVDSDGAPLMNGSAANSAGYHCMMGGEVYLHTWYITNTGKQQWTSDTELRLTWGSAELLPTVKSVRCPCLKPGEQGTISVNFDVPKKSGTYESYWNFYHGNVRFGNSLSCYIFVEEPLIATISPVSTFPQPEFCTNKSKPLHVDLEPLLQKDVHDFFEKNKIDENKPLELTKPDEASFDILEEACANNGSAQTKDGVKSPENSPPSRSENIEAEEELKSPKIVIYPRGIEDTSKVFTISVPAETERILWYPPGANRSLYRPIEIPVKKIIGWETKSEAPIVQQSLKTYCSTGQVFADNNCIAIIRPTTVADNACGDMTLKHGDVKYFLPDSDWDSVCSFDRYSDDYETNFKDTSNKYGILEKDLIVDLSTNKEAPAVEKENKEEKLNVVTSEDNNNNNGTMENNNCSKGSISEAESEDSSVSSGYDVLQVPVCEEKEDNSGYVYITIDGNKLPVPKHILRPDFLASAEEAPGPISTDDERPAEKSIDSKENTNEQVNSPAKSESPLSEPKQDIRDHTTQDNKPSPTLTPEIATDASAGRLFIFPQNQPGYEVFRNKDHSTHSLNRMDSFEPYTWSTSPTQYNLTDPLTMDGANSMHLRNDPYGPLDNSSSSFVEHHPTPDQPIHPSCPFASYGGNHYYPHCRSPAQFPHVPNYQQCGPRYQEPAQSPSAPPQPPQQPESPKSPELAQAAPVHHILPENFVNGAVNVASSAINTARSVINMLASPKPEAGRWVNGHWVTENPESLRAKNLVILNEMGFWNPDLNATLLARHNDDIAQVITDLVE